MSTNAYPHEIRIYARGLYVQGNSYNQTAKLVKAQFPGARCNAETIKRWALADSWDKTKVEIRQTVDEKQKESVASMLEEHGKLYQEMIDKGKTDLKTAQVRSAAEASSLIDTGIKGQRTTLKDLVSINFVKAVFLIVSEEVMDEEARRRIARRFRELAQIEEVVR